MPYFKNLVKETASDDQKIKERKKDARIAKSGGDDMYSWALFIKGKETYNGMSKSEAAWRRDNYIKTGKL